MQVYEFSQANEKGKIKAQKLGEEAKAKCLGMRRMKEAHFNGLAVESLDPISFLRFYRKTPIARSVELCFKGCFVGRVHVDEE